MNSFRWVTAFSFVGITSLSTVDAYAQDQSGETSSAGGDSSRASSADAGNDSVETLINDAIALFKAGNYRRSIEKFKQGYERVADPNILFNIARCYHLLGDKNNAVEYYNRFIFHPEVPEDSKPRAKQYLDELNQSAAGASGDVSPLDEQESSASASESESDQSGALDPSVGQTDSAGSAPRVLEWTLVGSGLAVAVAGGILGGIALSKHNAFESSTDFDKKQDLENQGSALALASDVCLGVGGAVAVTGVILLAVRSQKKNKSQEHLAYLPLLSPRVTGVSLTYQF